MAEKSPDEFTAAAGRRFGATVGGAFLVLAGLVWWRGHVTTATVFAIIGAVLVVLGLVVPLALGPVERAWMAFAKVLSKVTTPVAMGAIYLIVLSGVGFLRRRLASNPLVHAESSRGFWKERSEGMRRSASMQRQF
jgi:hypothetical protein